MDTPRKKGKPRGGRRKITDLPVEVIAAQTKRAETRKYQRDKLANSEELHARQKPTKLTINFVVMEDTTTKTKSSPLDVFTNIGQVKMLGYILEQVKYLSTVSYMHTADNVKCLSDKYGYSRTTQSTYISQLITLGMLIRKRKGEYQINSERVQLYSKPESGYSFNP